jgi:prefoldin subunit 5
MVYKELQKVRAESELYRAYALSLEAEVASLTARVRELEAALAQADIHVRDLEDLTGALSKQLAQHAPRGTWRQVKR